MNFVGRRGLGLSRELGPPRQGGALHRSSLNPELSGSGSQNLGPAGGEARGQALEGPPLHQGLPSSEQLTNRWAAVVCVAVTPTLSAQHPVVPVHEWGSVGAG